MPQAIWSYQTGKHDFGITDEQGNLVAQAFTKSAAGRIVNSVNLYGLAIRRLQALMDAFNAENAEALRAAMADADKLLRTAAEQKHCAPVEHW
jgi:hypothetical protein